MPLFRVQSVCLALIILFLTFAPSRAQTPTTQWVNFYSSNSLLDKKLVPVGAIVRAYDDDNVLCGTFTVQRSGYYGFLPCYIDDPNTSIDEGVMGGDNVSFTINNSSAGNYLLSSTIQNGDRFEVNLSAISSKASSPPVSVPEPVTVILFSSGLAVLAGFVRRQRR